MRKGTEAMSGCSATVSLPGAQGNTAVAPPRPSSCVGEVLDVPKRAFRRQAQESAALTEQLRARSEAAEVALQALQTRHGQQLEAAARSVADAKVGTWVASHNLRPLLQSPLSHGLANSAS